MTVQAKICGIRTQVALEAALAGGAEYVGFEFLGPSPRNVSLEAAKGLADAARGRAKIVALLVDPDDRMVDETVRGIGPDFLQLHGIETPERVRQLKSKAGVPIIKAIKVETAADAAAAFDYRSVADVILFDAKAPKGAVLPGGNGLAFDWRVLDGVKDKREFMLSGGLNPGNVAEAIRLTGAHAVDVSSGVETSPGEKSEELIGRFLAAVKGVKT